MNKEEKIKEDLSYSSEESVVALIGPIASGKGTVADLLINQEGYTPFNYGDVIFEERTRLGLKEERKNSNAVGASLRLRFGNDVIARKIAASIQKFRNQKLLQKILIDGLRHPDEIVWVKKNLGAQVVGINASQEVRYQRSVKRNRIVDPKLRADFNEVDEEDRGVNIQDHANQTDACLKLADIIIENNDEDIEEYIKKFREGLKALGILNK